MQKNKNEKQLKSVAFEVKTISDDGTFTGYGSVFGNVDSYGDIIQQGAFQKTLADRGDKIALLWQHDTSQPIGIYPNIKEDSYGLFVTGQLNLDVQQGKEAYSLLKQGALNGLSIGFQSVRADYDETTGIRTLQEIKLYEISLVTFPANEAATVTTVKSAFEDLDEEKRVKVLTYINSLNSSPQTEVTPPVVVNDQDKDKHLTKTDADTKQSEEPLLHSLEKLRAALKN